MSMLDFTAKVNQSKIEVPDEYLQELEQVEMVQIKIKKPSQNSVSVVEMIAELINNPLYSDNGIPIIKLIVI